MASANKMFPDHLSMEQYIPTGAELVVSHQQVTRHYSLHWHDFFELELIIAGSGTHYINGIAFPLSPGSLFLITQSDFHEMAADAGSEIQLINVQFLESFLDEEVQQLLFSSTIPLAVQLDYKELSSTHAELVRLQEECNAKRPGRRTVQKAILERMIVELIRRTAPIGSESQDDREHDAIYRARRYLHRQFRQPVTLQSTAKTVNLSPQYFSQSFHQKTGVTFQNYLSTLRLQFSCSLLKCSRLSVTQVCMESGFNSVSYFSRLFHSRYGMSPSAFQKLCATSSPSDEVFAD